MLAATIRKKAKEFCVALMGYLQQHSSETSLLSLSRFLSFVSARFRAGSVCSFSFLTSYCVSCLFKWEKIVNCATGKPSAPARKSELIRFIVLWIHFLVSGQFIRKCVNAALLHLRYRIDIFDGSRIISGPDTYNLQKGKVTSLLKFT